MPSLQDQLLKAGMVDQKKAKRIEKEKRKQAKQTPKGQALPEQESKLLARQAAAERAARDKELNQANNEAAERTAIAAQIRQLIERHRIDRSDGDVAYQFSHGKKIKKLYVTTVLQNQLSKGLVAIVGQGKQYEIVPAVVADKIAQRDEGTVVLRNQADSKQVEDDDPYADYQIPDDLMW